MFEAKLKSRSQPKLGALAVTFPIPEERYEIMIFALQNLQIGDVRKQDCCIESIRAPDCPALLRMTNTMANVDELDWLGKQLCFHYTIDEHITEADFRNLFFRLVFTRNLIGRFNQICHDLIELRGILGGDDGNACAFLDRLPCDSSGLTALAGNRYVL